MQKNIYQNLIKKNIFIKNFKNYQNGILQKEYFILHN